MIVIIAGGRDYTPTEADFLRLDELHQVTPITEVVSGTARGADTGGERWAARRNIPVTRFKPQWERYGNSAGPRRNAEMAKYVATTEADGALVAFPGGGGTANMVQNAKKHGLKVYDWRD